MESHRTRQPQRRTPAGPVPRGAAAPPVGAGRAAVAPAASGQRVPPVTGLRRLPSPRLTGLGAGLFAIAVMLFLGLVDAWLFGGAPAVYGVLFLPVCALTALWVRSADLVTAPITVPIAFAVGTVPVAGGNGGAGTHAMAVVTSLAVHAGWLYGGTLVAGIITTVRKIRQMGRRQAIRDATARAAARSMVPGPGRHVDGPVVRQRRG